MKRQVANLTSNILNPFLVSIAVITLLSFNATASMSDALKWSAILTALSVLPLFLIIIYLVCSEKLEGIFISVRRQRTIVYVLAGICVAAGCVILLYMGAPPVLVAVFVAGLSSIIIFMSINFVWKISIHTAFAAASATILTIMYGSSGAFTAMLVPPIAWSRIELEHHSLAQTVAGALLASIIVVVVFHFFGLIGSVSPL